MNFLILGYAGSGKSTAAEILSNILNVNYANASDKIIEDFAHIKRLNAKDIKENKDTYRQDIYDFGRIKQGKTPSYPQLDLLENGINIITGVRNHDEIKYARDNKLYDLIIWIDRKCCKKDGTDRLDENVADIIINNDLSLEDLENKLVSISKCFKL